MKPSDWDRLGHSQAPSWYLDPVAARQKGEAYRKLVERSVAGTTVRRVLKTDLFEEAYGEDALLGAWVPEHWSVYGVDVSPSTAKRAHARFLSLGLDAVACDVCHAPFAAGSFDVVISPSTLDHFDNRQEFLSALQELERLVRPGGVLVITLDNPANPLYHVLRWASKSKVTGYPLGYTQTASGLEKDLRALRLEVFGRDWLLHNPRGISTLIFLAIRRALGRHADGVIRGLLGVFSLLGRLPTRSVTGCFLAVLARKPTVSPGRCKGPGSCA